ncbi:alpha-ketoacid dehydrogenase subunit beta [Rhodococcus sp. 05-340-1]|uniref:alpha-ketoacid dehydrogenase subunit beta n=1 Tax=unclassified Rhodococcus (in: high G+C Gram-positive bacteria) TaxID=192944 RepID=UPI000B9AB428|nr:MULTISPECIES: alpha-ketoacid dehydrogenase subunit beta [unclassified Rhodococcus (in: high G+C Gram-positive bacteria)]OZD68575.1 alpha-ketoacid dehydrogenase subunit beta [Rhodococcus sp. 05-340-2]OZD70153.1 alpha-ketoacid dehydrogenase subunit beta [Rhodococcus sp. 05-340-1]OZF40258.1 alpha-ketoacid dehydrogenase subunit beta [Rhodococcus sp. 14-2483-1-2]
MSTATETPNATATAPAAAGRVTTYVKAYNEAVAQVMREDEDVFVIGEDVAGYGGVFHMYDGLLDEFGPRRMVDTPIAEMGLIGLGVGAAARGLRPIVDIMFMDFLAVALDQVVNQAAKMKFMYGGEVKVPMVITVAYGAGVSAGAQHSQSLEAWLAHTPGLKVVMPSNAHDAKGLMVSAVRDDNPVVFMLNKVLLGARAEVPEDLYAIPLGEAAVPREGDDVTIVAFGRMVTEALKAADILAESGVSVEVVDPRTVQPLDTATIVKSASKTNRILVVHEAVTFGGIGAEVAAQIQEEAFDYLDAPVLRVGAPFTPVPFSTPLEKAYVPDADRIVAGVRRLLERN